MAANTIGLNQTFQIYNADDTPFVGLVLHKAAVDSVVMSLGDNISGEVYYRDNTLALTMQEYIVYNGVKYTLVNPPTILREGLVSDNSELKGMTKYSFVFYHPMYVLNNFPFSDVAVTSSQERYLSENTVFSWIGKPNDYIAKLNKNLEGTEWIVEKSSRFPQIKDNELSDVLAFSNNTIAEALKRGYDTWGVPYVVDMVSSSEAAYAQGKRFKVVWGLPSNEIYASQQDAQGNIPYVFKMGQGVGLKNNSRTPRNNKIITRIAGYGSENNVPYGYPQIVWTGNQDWDYTINNTSGMQQVVVGGQTILAMSYPIYDGIVGGQNVRLIKHPFTRTHLMPSVYTDKVNKKVNPNATGYNPNIDLVDYYDAVATQTYPYPNEINPLSPSYESHEFEDIKPELGNESLYGDAVPLNNDLTVASTWDDSLDNDGKYVQSYFRITLPQLSFDIYACAAITQEMQINMRSGACLGCTFTVQVDWEDYKTNFYDADGNFAPNGAQRDLDKYPRSDQGQINLVLQKETATFGTLMPNVYQTPKNGDQFVVLGISLPQSYITNAEQRLDAAMKSYMLENNVYYFDYPLKFDEAFLRNNTYILSQIKPNAVIRFEFAGSTLQLFVKQLTVKHGYGKLPQYDITLTDNVDVVLNQIGQVADDVERLSALIAVLRQSYNRSVWAELEKKLSRTQDDTAQGFIRMLKGIQVGAQYVPDILGSGGVFRVDSDGKVNLVTDTLYVRMKAYFDNVEIKDYEHTSGNRIASKAGIKCCRVEYIDGEGEVTENLEDAVKFRCYFRANDGDKKISNDFVSPTENVTQDFAFCDRTMVDGTLTNRRYWRAVVGRNGVLTDDDEFGYIDLSKTDCESNANNIPMEGDDIIQLGNRWDTERQGAIVEYVGGVDAPSYQIYQGINTYSLVGKNMIGFGYNSATGKAYMNVYGDMFIGAKPDQTTGVSPTFIKYVQGDGTEQHPPKLEIKALMEILPNSTYEGQTAQNFVRNNQITYDTAIQNLTNVTNNLQAQIDGQIESWFYNGVPSDSVPPESEWKAIDIAAGNNNERLKHLGDMYYDNQTGYAYRYSNTGTEANPVFVWTPISDSAVVKALADAAAALGLADTKARIFTTASGVLPNPPYKLNDIWVNATGTWGTGASAVTWDNDILKCVATNNGERSASISDWAKASKYTDDTYAHGFDFLTSNLARLSSTVIDGGLVLSSLIGLRDTNNDIQSGINGIVDTTKKGNGIAAWYGGEQGDLEDASHYSSITRKAKSLFRFDGSGYLAGGNITWDANGRVTITDLHTDDSGVSTDVLQEMSAFRSMFDLSIWSSTSRIHPLQNFDSLKITRASGFTPTNADVITYGEANNKYITVEFFDSLFQLYNGTATSGNKIAPNGTIPSSQNLNIKAMFGFWTEQYLSALGQGSGGGGGGGATALYGLLDVKPNSTSSPTAVYGLNGTSSDTGKILTYGSDGKWYAASAPASGVTSIATGTGLTGGTITSSGTISIDSTYQTYISHGESAYNSLGNYLSLSGGSMSNTNLVTNLNADLLDGYHASNIHNAAAVSINNVNTSNTHILIATIKIPGSNLAIAGFSAIFTNREVLTTDTFFLYLSIRRNSTSSVSADFYYMSFAYYNPKNLYVRSDDGQNFYVYLESLANTWYSYYALTKIYTEGDITFSNTGTTSLIAGSVLNKTAISGGIAAQATKLRTARSLWGLSFDGTQDLTGDIHVSHTGTTDSRVRASNSNGAIEILTSTNRGLYDRTTGTWVVATNGTNTWLSRGNVGIGTITPSYKLDVSGTARFTNSVDLGVNLYNSAGTYGLNCNNSDIIGVNRILTADVSDDFTESISFKRSDGNYDTFRAANGTFFFEFNNATAANTNKLTSNGFLLGHNTTDVWSDGTNSHPWYGIDNTHHNTGVYSFTISDFFGITLRTGGSNSGVFIKEGGNVGIGVTDPSYKLDINGSINSSSLGSINGFNSLELTAGSSAGNGGGIYFHYNGGLSYSSVYLTETTKGVLSVQGYGTTGLVVGDANNDYIQIGNIRLVYDSTNNALKVVKSDGSSAANFYATGGVASLGIASVSSSPYYNYLTVGTQLNVNGRAYFNDDIYVNVGGYDYVLDGYRCVELGILSS